MDKDKQIDELLTKGKVSLDNRDYGVAMEVYKTAATMGSSEAMVCLGEIYNEGFACKRDPKISLEYFRKAAELGNDNGMYRVGRAYSYGYAVEKDGYKALDWFEKAAEKGNIKAMLEVGDSYILRDFKCPKDTAYIGVAYVTRKFDVEKGLYWYKLAAKKANEIKDITLATKAYRFIIKHIRHIDLDVDNKDLILLRDECFDNYCSSVIALADSYLGIDNVDLSAERNARIGYNPDVIKAVLLYRQIIRDVKNFIDNNQEGIIYYRISNHLNDIDAVIKNDKLRKFCRECRKKYVAYSLGV